VVGVVGTVVVICCWVVGGNPGVVLIGSSVVVGIDVGSALSSVVVAAPTVDAGSAVGVVVAHAPQSAGQLMRM
jgi:hypothetical protein